MPPHQLVNFRLSPIVKVLHRLSVRGIDFFTPLLSKAFYSAAAAQLDFSRVLATNVKPKFIKETLCQFLVSLQK